jgi:hypothetical protein
MVKENYKLAAYLGLLLSMLPAISAAAAEDSRTNERENPFSDLKEDDCIIRTHSMCWKKVSSMVYQTHYFLLTVL